MTQVFIKTEKDAWNNDFCATVTIKWTHRKKTTTKCWRPRKQAQQHTPLKAKLTWTHAFHTLLTLCSSAIPSHCTKGPINENASLGIFKNKHPETTNVSCWPQCRVQMQGYECVGPGAERNRNGMKALNDPLWWGYIRWFCAISMNDTGMKKGQSVPRKRNERIASLKGLR